MTLEISSVLSVAAAQAKNVKERKNMRIQTEMRLCHFEFWAGAEDNAKHLSWEQLDTIEEILSEVYPDGIDETTLNDLFWFEPDVIAEWLGYGSFDELVPPWD